MSDDKINPFVIRQYLARITTSKSLIKVLPSEAMRILHQTKAVPLKQKAVNDPYW